VAGASFKIPPVDPPLSARAEPQIAYYIAYNIQKHSVQEAKRMALD